MDRAVVTAKGQIVIPAKLRRKFGIKKGTQVYIYERNGELAIKPITDDYIRNMAGMAGTKGKLLKALMAGKAKERELLVPPSSFRFHPSSLFLPFRPRGSTLPPVRFLPIVSCLAPHPSRLTPNRFFV
jgi:AbrB family looped-hinge helix DNA binding protein